MTNTAKEDGFWHVNQELQGRGITANLGLEDRCWLLSTSTELENYLHTWHTVLKTILKHNTLAVYDMSSF